MENVEAGKEETMEVPVDVQSGKSTSCIVCDKEQVPYKCPKCFLKYCSVACYKLHQNNCSGVPMKRENTMTPTSTDSTSGPIYRKYYYPTEDTIPTEKLRVLSEGDNLTELKKFLEDPKIRSNILTLDSCADPVYTFNEIMENEKFVQFAAFVTNSLNKDQATSQQNNIDLSLDDVVVAKI